ARCRGGRSEPPPVRGATALVLLRLELQRAGIDAVALPGGGRAVVEHVTQMATTTAAHHLGASHEQAALCPQLDALGHPRLLEAGPAGPRVELGLGIEQLGAAAGA